MQESCTLAHLLLLLLLVRHGIQVHHLSTASTSAIRLLLLPVVSPSADVCSWLLLEVSFIIKCETKAPGGVPGKTMLLVHPDTEPPRLGLEPQLGAS
jgi:hypothetical protein